MSEADLVAVRGGLATGSLGVHLRHHDLVRTRGDTHNNNTLNTLIWYALGETHNNNTLNTLIWYALEETHNAITH